MKIFPLKKITLISATLLALAALLLAGCAGPGYSSPSFGGHHHFTSNAIPPPNATRGGV